MTAGIISKVADVQAPVRGAGGDNEVPRDARGRPRIEVECWLCSGAGQRLNLKTQNMNKCSGCKGAGKREKSYTRVTTYIDVLDDKSNLEAWQMRMVLVGASAEPDLLNGAADLHATFRGLERKVTALAGDLSDEANLRREEIEAEQKSIKDELNRRAQIAKQKAGAEDKADKGTHLHGLSELVDQGLHLPPGVEFGDVIDMDAYRKATRGLKIIHMEKLVVNDEIQCAGTPDRVSEWSDPDNPLIAPDGHVFLPGELIITDLKTGTVQYGGLKMAMQLSIYSRSDLYDHTNGERSPLGNINQKWGIIMNVPAGTGVAQLYWADLELGWRAVQIAGQVREIRSTGRNALSSFLSPIV